jgi:hypothetical protein
VAGSPSTPIHTACSSGVRGSLADLKGLTTEVNFELTDCFLAEGIIAGDARVAYSGGLRCIGVHLVNDSGPVCRTTWLPLPPAALSFMHMLPCLSSPPLNDHAWAASLPLHCQATIPVRRAELSPESSAHMPA